MTKTKDLLWDFIVENNVATEDECSLVTSINGYSEETMMDIIFARTDLRSIEQCYDDNMWCSNELLERFGLLPDEDESDEDED